jgi:hypothetical protein
MKWVRKSEAPALLCGDVVTGEKKSIAPGINLL